jgi:hypothetical protein
MAEEKKERTMSRKAIVIGIDYVGQGNALYGCVYDALLNVRHLIDHWSFKPHEIILLVDRDPYQYTLVPIPPGIQFMMPTKQNILKVLKEMSAASWRGHPHPAEALHPLWFSYSGHGSRQVDTSGDEKDGRDEVLVPVDVATAGVISDDSLHAIWKTFSPHTTIVGLVDACHSGTMFDLPFMYRQSDGDWIHATSDSMEPPACRMLLISGCMDHEYAQESVTQTNGTYHGIGAMTSSFWEVLERHHFQISCEALCTKLNQTLRANGFPQQPQLSSTESVMNSLFCVQPDYKAWMQL